MPVFNQSRSYIIRIIFAIAFLVILVQLFNLQVLSSKYQLLAQQNAFLRKTVYPARGIVYDRKGRPIVKNTLMYDLMVTPTEVKGVDTAYLCKLLDIDTAEFHKRILTAILKGGPVRASAFEDLLTPERYARLEENMWRFGNGFFLQERPVRTYPYNVGGHFMGYIGEVDSGIIARSGGFYEPGDYVGRSGLEASYEKVLMGQRGVQVLIKDFKNRVVGKYANGEMDEPAAAGRGLHTYLDVELQQLAEKLLKNKVGAIVAIDPKTGGVLAMASGPVYSPNELSGASFKKTYARLNLDVSRPFLNRAIKGQYPAGSTFKPVGALIGLDEGVIGPKSSISCTGAYYGCARPVKCTEKWPGHAASLRLAIAHSCNSFFSMTFRATIDNPKYGNAKDGYEKWKEYVNAFGLGHQLGIDLPSEDKGNIADTAFYNKRYNNSWNSCTNVSLGIGQGEMSVTPLQIANVMAIIANKGYYYIPHFVNSIENEESGDTLLNKYRVQHKIPVHISDTLYNLVKEGMHDVTVVGTAASIPKIPGIDICAKTGTAENKIILDGRIIQLADHSVFGCFAPKDDPKIALAVIVENGGFGATWAGPMAYLMVEKYLTDSLRADRVVEADRISNANLMPEHLPRLQYKEDSIRAYFYFNLTKDSSYIKKYMKKFVPYIPRNPKKPLQNITFFRREDMVEPEMYTFTRKKNNAS
ncbi:MAG: penicillin-binding protein 2 [Flavisolibacter sp.]